MYKNTHARLPGGAAGFGNAPWETPVPPFGSTAAMYTVRVAWAAVGPGSSDTAKATPPRRTAASTVSLQVFLVMTSPPSVWHPFHERKRRVRGGEAMGPPRRGESPGTRTPLPLRGCPAQRAPCVEPGPRSHSPRRGHLPPSPHPPD